MIKKDLVYWDSCTFLGWFNDKEEPENTKKCLGTIKAAEREEIIIVTSAITLIEVIKIKGKNQLSQENEKIIKDFFENNFIKVVNVERFVAEDARYLIWKYPHLNPKDSIHLATTLRHNVPLLNSFDDHLLKLNGKIEGIKITEPNIDLNHQQPIELKYQNPEN